MMLSTSIRCAFSKIITDKAIIRLIVCSTISSLLIAKIPGNRVALNKVSVKISSSAAKCDNIPWVENILPQVH